MILSPPSIVRSDDAIVAAAPGSPRRYRLATASLTRGMFVVELDRPWVDTPFLLQGFLIDSEIELDTLRRSCVFVYVDIDLSNPEVVDSIRAGEMLFDAPHGKAPADLGLASAPDTRPVEAAAPPSGRADLAQDLATLEPTSPNAPRAAGARDPATRPAAAAARIRQDVKVSAETRQRFRAFVKSTLPGIHADDVPPIHHRVLGWLRALFGGDGDDAAGRHAAIRESERRVRGEARASLGGEEKLRRYAERRSVEEEMPRARQALGSGEAALQTLIAEVRSGGALALEPVRAAIDQMVETMLDNPDALLWVLRMREENQSAYEHGVKVAVYLIALGRQLGFPQAELSHLGMIGMLADLGKTKLPRALLDKPGMLSAAEYSIVKEHVRLGLDALRAGAPLPPEVERGIADHHERLDGSGYPRGLKGNAISFHGRMAAIVDSFAALVTPRPYANAVAPQEALMNLYQWSGRLFHEPLVEQFVQAIGVFPVGSLVELSSGEVAAVIAHNRARRLEPRVLVLTWPDKRLLSQPVERDLLAEKAVAGGSRTRIERGLPAGAYGIRSRDYYAKDGTDGELAG